MARMVAGKLKLIIPCEVQSADTTGNYRANWDAYSKELDSIPDSEHGMNWANIWKRLIPQLILKGSIAPHPNYANMVITLSFPIACMVALSD
jgi:hypothetical protein